MRVWDAGLTLVAAWAHLRLAGFGKDHEIRAISGLQLAQPASLSTIAAADYYYCLLQRWRNCACRCAVPLVGFNKAGELQQHDHDDGIAHAAFACKVFLKHTGSRASCE